MTRRQRKPHQRKRWRRVFATLMTASFVFSITPAYADPLPTAIQIEQLELDIQHMDNDITESIDKLQKFTLQLAEKEGKIQETQKEITKAETSYNRTLDMYKDRLVVLQGNTTDRYMLMFTTLLNSNGLSNFFQRTEAIATIMQSDQNLMNSLDKKKKTLDQKKEQLEKETKELQDAKNQIEQETFQLEKKKKQVEAQVLQLKIQQAYQTSLSSITPIDVTLLPNASDKAKSVINEGQQYLGVPYVWGGTTPNGFDCSGLTQYVYQKAGVNLPRTAREQQKFGVPIAVEQVQPGDLLFWGHPAHHVAIYVGNGMYLHAPQTGDVVQFSSSNILNVTSAVQVLF